MIQPYLNTFRSYADFSGRTGRREFWLTWIVHSVVIFASYWLDIFILFIALDINVPVFLPIYLVASLLPMLSLGARRLRDYGRSAWWLLLWLHPIFWFPLMVTAFSPSKTVDDRREATPRPLDTEIQAVGRVTYVGTWLNGLDFKGLATRGEYWSFLLLNFAILVGAAVVAYVIEELVSEALVGVVMVPAAFLFAMSWLTGLSLTVRRVRDSMGSGSAFFVAFIPIIGPLLVYIVFPLIPSRPLLVAQADDWRSDQRYAVDRSQSWGSDSAGASNDPWDRR